MSFTHWQVPAVHVKFSLPAPLGHPQLMVLPHPFVSVPHAEPSAFAGQICAVQHAFGFATVLQVCPPGQPQVMVPPQPFEKVPHASPPAWLGPFGTFWQVYGVPTGHAHVPTWPGVFVEQSCPFGHEHAMVPPMPLSRPVPHLPL